MNTRKCVKCHRDDMILNDCNTCLECLIANYDYCQCDIYKEGYECFNKLRPDAVLVGGDFVNPEHLPQALASMVQGDRS